ncbi:phosphotransferase [Chloroflexi bacterium TSY]|nr:phosphotransferase [Chloroflexi bacterium TSY]
MTDVGAELKNIPIEKLTEIVRQAQDSPTFEIIDWTATPLQFHQVIETTGGLFLFQGSGQSGDEVLPWSVVLKIVNDPGGQPEPTFWAYWKRELMLYQSGLLDDLPNTIRAPRCYGVEERPGQGGWIWLEYMVESTPKHWSMAEYFQAAHALGLFGATYLDPTRYPDYPWLTKDFFRSALMAGDWWAQFMDPTQPDNAWSYPIVKQAFSQSAKEHVLRLWAEREVYMDALDRLPQTLCHYDASRRNLMIGENVRGGRETVLIDWAFAGRGALGLDLQNLVLGTLFWSDMAPDQASDLEATALEGYFAGLRDGGWKGDPQMVRLAYTASLVLRNGLTIPGWTAYLLSDDQQEGTVQQFGRSVEEILSGWVSLLDFVLERADEAVQLMRQF